ncbi:hypothetical protein [Vibrio breoganii]|uniref:hypothetical protein n=1 Tax=Vibrio breoganii TaxID=553239 RepID=UPI000C839C6D|nr:hypothetical protein [Vibrio breoganii]PMK26292.1 hypothetical protein BCU03_19070 [Vibrio breoganii]
MLTGPEAYYGLTSHGLTISKNKKKNPKGSSRGPQTFWVLRGHYLERTQLSLVDANSLKKLGFVVAKKQGVALSEAKLRGVIVKPEETKKTRKWYKVNGVVKQLYRSEIQSLRQRGNVVIEYRPAHTKKKK